ncbi:MAG: MarR family transcriptional regulator [Spirochaetia bacterium]|nr:MarR family transcriptional regulator [Spirochaetia bacterium]
MINLCALRQLIMDLHQVEDHLKVDVGVTFNEAAILCAIDTGYTEPAAIAKQMNLSPSRTSRLLTSVEAKKLINRKNSRVDKRVVHISLSQRGQKVLEELHACDAQFPAYIEEAILKGMENADEQ